MLSLAYVMTDCNPSVRESTSAPLVRLVESMILILPWRFRTMIVEHFPWDDDSNSYWNHQTT